MFFGRKRRLVRPNTRVRLLQRISDHSGPPADKQAPVASAEQPATSTQIPNAKDSPQYAVGEGSKQSTEVETSPTVAEADTFAKIPEPLPVEATEPASSPRNAFSGGRTWVVQLSAQRTEEEAQAAFRAAQAKYGVLKGYPVLIRKKDQGGRGVFFATQVGPLARDEENRWPQR
jgi:hypothetical protein